MESKLILIVEEGELDRDFVSESLQEDGFKVIYANDAQIALTIITTSQPFLILMDMQLSKIDSYTFSRILKNDQDTVAIKLIVFSNQNPNPNKIVYSGFDGFIYNTGSSAKILEELNKYILTNK